MLRAVPAIMLIAVSMFAAFRSGILISAILRTCSFVSWPTFVLFGTPEADSRPSSFLMRTGAGGVFVMKLNVRSA